MISGDSETPWIFEGIDDLKGKIDTHRDNYAKQQQQIEDDVNTLTDSMHKMAADIINIRKDINSLSTKMKKTAELLKPKKRDKSHREVII
jgi:predicted  nucleic acid-binding Zn-ribbon protein